MESDRSLVGHAVFSHSSEQPLLQTATSSVRFIALGEQTERDFGLFEYVLAAASGGASPHYHRGFSETFYILDGSLDILNGHDWVAAGNGDLVYVPRESVHGFRNSSNDPVRFLILFTPGVAREAYFRGIAERRAAGITLSEAEQDQFAAQYDQYNVR